MKRAFATSSGDETAEDSEEEEECWKKTAAYKGRTSLLLSMSYRDWINRKIESYRRNL